MTKKIEILDRNISNYDKQNCVYLINEDNIYLLHKIDPLKTREPTYGKLIGLGGKLEIGENSKDSVIRELKEEVNHDLQILDVDSLILNHIGVLVMHIPKRVIDIYVANSPKIPETYIPREGPTKWYNKNFVKGNENLFMSGDLVFWPFLFTKEKFRVDVINKQVYSNNDLL